MKREDFWTVFLVLLAGALLWFVVHVFWGHNEHRRNIDLGIDQRAPVDPRGDRFSDASAVATRSARDLFRQHELDFFTHFDKNGFEIFLETLEVGGNS